MRIIRFDQGYRCKVCNYNRFKEMPDGTYLCANCNTELDTEEIINIDKPVHVNMNLQPQEFVPEVEIPQPTFFRNRQN